MTTLRTIREHERLWREGAPGVPPGAKMLPARAFEELARSEERRESDDGSVFLLGRHNVKAQSWVGVVRAGGVQIEILPKTQGSTDAAERMNLLEMLRYAGALPVRERDIAALSARRAPIDDLVVELFAARLEEELVRGPDRGYRVLEENLSTMRGRLHIPRHVTLNAAHRERFLCRFDEFNVDTQLSRALKAVARHLSRHTGSERARQTLTRSLVMLDDVADVTDIVSLLDDVYVHRQNGRFSDLVTFARLVAANMSPSFRAGDLDTFSLLFPMERVFEGFIAGFLGAHVLPSYEDLRLRRQGKGHRPALLRSRATNRAVLPLKPDLLFETGGAAVLVADTKWKLLRENRRAQGVSEADLYQLHAYLTRYESRRGLLLFPKSLDGQIDEDLDFLSPEDLPNGASIAIRAVNLARDLTKRPERVGLAAELKAMIDGAADGVQSHSVHADKGLGAVA